MFASRLLRRGAARAVPALDKAKIASLLSALPTIEAGAVGIVDVPTATAGRKKKPVPAAAASGFDLDAVLGSATTKTTKTTTTTTKATRRRRVVNKKASVAARTVRRSSAAASKKAKRVTKTVNRGATAKSRGSGATKTGRGRRVAPPPAAKKAKVAPLTAAALNSALGAALPDDVAVAQPKAKAPRAAAAAKAAVTTEFVAPLDVGALVGGLPDRPAAKAKKARAVAPVVASVADDFSLDDALVAAVDDTVPSSGKRTTKTSSDDASVAQLDDLSALIDGASTTTAPTATSRRSNGAAAKKAPSKTADSSDLQVFDVSGIDDMLTDLLPNSVVVAEEEAPAPPPAVDGDHHVVARNVRASVLLSLSGFIVLNLDQLPPRDYTTPFGKVIVAAPAAAEQGGAFQMADAVKCDLVVNPVHKHFAHIPRLMAINVRRA